MMLEDDLQRQLQVERLAGSDAWRTVEVAYSVNHLTKSASGIIARRSQIDAVEQVEDFNPELCADAFDNLRIFIYGEIHRTISRPVVFISCQIPKRTGSGLSERSRIHPLHKLGAARVGLDLMRDACKRITD